MELCSEMSGTDFAYAATRRLAREYRGVWGGTITWQKEVRTRDWRQKHVIVCATRVCRSQQVLKKESGRDGAGGMKVLTRVLLTMSADACLANDEC
eukprot:3893257-Rhodomonas_salina.2